MNASTIDGHQVNYTRNRVCLHQGSVCYEILIKLKIKDYYIFRFNRNSSKVYLMKDSMSLTLRSRRYFDDQTSELEDRYKLGSQRDCVDYSELTNRKCFSKQDCIDLCVLEIYSKQYQKLPLLILYDEELDAYGNYSFSSKRNATILVYCRAKFAKPECNYTVYNRDNKMVPLYLPDQKKWNISLFENERNFYEIVENAKDKLFLDLFTISQILLGVNVPMLLQVISTIFNFKITRKLKFFINLLILIFFGFQFYNIMKHANEKMQFIFYYDSFLKDDIMNINVCIDHKINLNEIDTGADLEKRTKNISIENLIKSIHYVDSNFNFQVWQPELGLKNLSSNLKIEPVFYLNFKCIKIQYNLDLSNLNLIFHVYYLKILLKDENFNRYTLFVNSPFTFFNKTTYEITYTNMSYSVNLDHYVTIKSNIFRNHKKENLFVVLDKFKNLYNNRTTLNLFLTEPYFSYQIDDKLFDDFLKRYNVLDNLAFTVRFDTKINLIDDCLNEFEKKFSLCFGKNVFKYISIISNKKNLPSILIEVFNSVGLWFTLSCFDVIYLLLIYLEKRFINFMRKDKQKTKIIIIRNLIVSQDLYDRLCVERMENNCGFENDSYLINYFK